VSRPDGLNWKAAILNLANKTLLTPIMLGFARVPTNSSCQNNALGVSLRAIVRGDGYLTPLR